MQETPWGPLELLREKRPPAGSRGEEAKRRQRELFYAAMVACCERRGFENTGVDDLLAASGLSRGTFYAHFADKFDCFGAAEAEMLRLGLAELERSLRDEGDLAQRARHGLEAIVGLVIAQPAAARACLIDCYTAGEPGMSRMAAAIETVTALARRTLGELPWKLPMRDALARAIISGFFKVIYNRVAARRTEELRKLVPALWEWALSYLGLPEPLRAGRAASRDGAAALPPFAALSPEQRLIRAFAAVAAQRSYPATTVADVCAAASASQTTFYRYFADKRDLLAAALHSSGEQLLAAALPAARRAPDWPSAVVAAVEEACTFMAAEPDLTVLRTREVYAGGEEAIAIRDATVMRALRELLAPALAERPELPDCVPEAIGGAIIGVLYDALHEGGPEGMPRAAPLVSYLVLAPLLGARRAHEVASAKPASRARSRARGSKSS